MQIIKLKRKKKYPKWKIKRCDCCKSLLRVDFEDCHLERTVLGLPAYYAACPSCGNEIHYCYMT